MDKLCPIFYAARLMSGASEVKNEVLCKMNFCAWHDKCDPGDCALSAFETLMEDFPRLRKEQKL